mmetsp:Transcript_28772/g.37612  ORF Transcript_28772/g.37612 Transcript_28772/m.37612 type:complete len:111 (+) Transcript_28772:208-540(+)
MYTWDTASCWSNSLLLLRKDLFELWNPMLSESFDWKAVVLHSILSMSSLNESVARVRKTNKTTSPLFFEVKSTPAYPIFSQVFVASLGMQHHGFLFLIYCFLRKCTFACH